MKLYKLLFFIIVNTFIFSACEKVIQLDLNKAAAQIVIQGNITNEAGPYSVVINQSVPFDNANVFPPVTGAVVKITDGFTGITEVLAEVLPGVYKTSNTVGVEGRNYQLQVQSNGKEYTAASSMPQNVLLDSVTFFTNTFLGNTLTNPLPNFQDPAGVNNYYYFRQTINSKPSKTFFVFDDRLSDGRYISRQLFNDSAYIKKSDTVGLEMHCIDKASYNYYYQITEARGAGNSGPVAAPGNPVSNFSNGALGYFNAHTIQRKKAVFK